MEFENNVYLCSGLKTKIYMALEIRPIPVLTGEDAQRFVDRAEAAERNPQKVELSMTRDDIRKMMSTAKLY